MVHKTFNVIKKCQSQLQNEFISSLGLDKLTEIDKIPKLNKTLIMNILCLHIATKQLPNLESKTFPDGKRYYVTHQVTSYLL
jgi:hypothetical protein